LVEDCLELLNLSVKRKKEYISEEKSNLKNRVLTGKKPKMTKEERE